MKILLINHNWFKTSLQAMGHEVMSCGFSDIMDLELTQPMIHIDTIVANLPNGFRPDVIIWLDNSAPFLITGFDTCPIPLVMYSVDTHHHADLHALTAPMFDLVLIAQKDYMPIFHRHHCHPTWFPLWAPIYVEPSKKKRFDVAFVGNLNPKLNPKRVKFFDELKALTPVHTEIGEYWRIFPHSKIVVNQTVKLDINFRVFEAMMCGTTLLTEKTGNGLLELFRDGEHFVTYEPENAADAAQKIEQLLANPERCEQIADSGRAEILRAHTEEHRVRQLVPLIEGLKRRTLSASAHYAAMINFSALATTARAANVGLSNSALISGLRCAEQALRYDQSPSEIISAHLVLIAVKYDQASNTKSGQGVLYAYASKYPDNRLLAFAAVRALLNDGNRAEAEARALLLSNKPVSETFERAELIVTSLIESLCPTA